MECAHLNYVLEALAALFAGLFVTSEALAYHNYLDCKSVSQLVLCSCVKTVRIFQEYTPNITPRTSLDLVRRVSRGSKELPRVTEEV